MTTGCVFLNPLRRDGTSQMQRMVRALAPSSAPIDARDAEALLVEAAEYARLLQYYTPSNVPGGDWTDFLANDVSMLAALVAREDPETWQLAFDTRRARALEHDANRSAALMALFEPIVGLAVRFHDWHRRASAGLALKDGLDRLIRTRLAPTVADALALLARARDITHATQPAVTAADFDGWDLGAVAPDTTFLVSGTLGTPQEFREAVARLGRVFDRLQEGLVSAAASARDWFRETLDSHPYHQPHVALFLAFLALFRHAQDQLNGLTEKHLDFYYHEVLRLLARPGEPDRVHIVFELAKNFDRHAYSVPAGTVLLGGKDRTGVERRYTTERELVVNRAAIAADGLKTVFIEKDPSGNVRHVYAGPAADSADGRGAALTDADGKWQTFGDPSRPGARLGFAAASPMFLLAEGERTITIALQVDPAADFTCEENLGDIKHELQHNVKVQASGAKQWLDLTTEVVAIADAAAGDPRPREVVFTLKLDAASPAIVGYGPKVLGGEFDTDLPIVRFLCNNDGLSARNQTDLSGPIVDYDDRVADWPPGALVRFEGTIYKAAVGIITAGVKPGSGGSPWVRVARSNPYKYFQRMAPWGLRVVVEADPVRDLVLENDVGLLDPSKPFFPFGPMPRVGSYFYVGSGEIFRKPLAELELKVTWAGLPMKSFASHYTVYNTHLSGSMPVSGNAYKAKADLLAHGRWETLPAQTLFAAVARNDAVDPSRPAETADLDLTPKEPPATIFDPDPFQPPFQRLDVRLRQGFVRLTLQNHFGHAVYPQVLATAAIKQDKVNIPNVPYTPAMASLEVHYKAEQTIHFANVGRNGAAARASRFFRIWPFGWDRAFPARDAAAQEKEALFGLVPEFTVTAKRPNGSSLLVNAEGTLYVGLENVRPPQNVTLLCQVAEGSEDPDVPRPPAVVWSYLTARGWCDFQPSEVAFDSTNGLLASGIVELAMPESTTEGNTTMPIGLRWIKASVAGDSSGLPKRTALHTQAVVATFRNGGNDPAHLAAPLPAGSIAKLQTRAAAIKSIAQPYSSFGGRMAEPPGGFRVRISERLRHKRRAVTIFDYERLVLEQFPDVYKVKCVNHARIGSEHAPGSVRVVVVPNLRNRNAVDPLRPRFPTDRLLHISRYLADVATGFVTIEVTNPQYEEIRVRFNVRFRQGVDKGLYTGQLNDDIVGFLSPWLHDYAADLTLGGRVHRSAILNFIEERPYVDFVTMFQLDQIVDGRTLADLEKAEATTSASALVAAPHHDIGDRIVSCVDQPPEESADAGVPSRPEPPLDVPPGSPRYLGNSRVREMHDLLSLTSQCLIREIDHDRRFYFSDLRVGLELGYDYCAYCFGRDLSKR